MRVLVAFKVSPGDPIAAAALAAAADDAAAVAAALAAGIQAATAG